MAGPREINLHIHNSKRFVEVVGQLVINVHIQRVVEVIGPSEITVLVASPLRTRIPTVIWSEIVKKIPKT